MTFKVPTQLNYINSKFYFLVLDLQTKSVILFIILLLAIHIILFLLYASIFSQIKFFILVI